MDKFKEKVNAFLFKLKLKITSLLPKRRVETLDTLIDANTQVLPMSPRKRISRILLTLGVLLIIFSPIINFGVAGYMVSLQAKKLVISLSSKNLGTIKKELAGTQSSFSYLHSSYQFISPLKYIPFLGRYVSDLGHVIVAGEHGLLATNKALSAFEPYAGVAGLTGGTGKALSSQEQIDALVKATPELVGEIDKISEELVKVNAEIEKIDATAYPVSLFGFTVRAKVEQAQSLVGESLRVTTQGKPLLLQLPYLAGLDGPRKYLVLFQNDKELRPTGGFLTAYALVAIEKGEIKSVNTDDIYNLDSVYKPTLDAPEPLVKYIQGPYVLSEKLRLRDLNWNPDVPTSMATLVAEAEKAGLPQVDGIIAVDTQTLVNLLGALGPINVAGYGEFSTKIIPQCNCAQVVFELESLADVEGPIVWDPVSGKIVFRPPNSENRKKVLGPLMNAILENAVHKPKERLPEIMLAMVKSLSEKHVLVYFKDEKSQMGAEAFDIAGKMKDYSGGDYLFIVDANLGGRKSNLYVKEEVEQTIKVGQDNFLEKNLTITYRNPERQDGWLNSVLPDWVRIYVPKGSELLSADGFEEKAEPYEENGKTVFSGLVRVRPEGVSKLIVKYRLPIKAGSSYKLLIQKQPGKESVPYLFNVGAESQQVEITTDRAFEFPL